MIDIIKRSAILINTRYIKIMVSIIRIDRLIRMAIFIGSVSIIMRYIIIMR